MNRDEIEACLCAIVELQDEDDSPAFGQALTKLDALARDPKADVHPRLRHYLERRSYAKALEWLREPED